MKTREHILSVALEMINVSGAEAVGVRDIAREAGIAPGNLSYHFPRKEDLLSALLAEHSQGNDAFFDGLGDPAMDLEGLMALFRQSFQQQYAYRGLLLDVLVIGRLMGKDFDYASVRKRRLARLDAALECLDANDHIQANPSERILLRDLMVQNTRFWMHNALATYGNIKPSRDIPQCLKRLRGLLTLYAPQRAQRTQ